MGSSPDAASRSSWYDDTLTTGEEQGEKREETVPSLLLFFIGPVAGLHI
jgi:hypothetical protein